MTPTYGEMVQPCHSDAPAHQSPRQEIKRWNTPKIQCSLNSYCRFAFHLYSTGWTWYREKLSLAPHHRWQGQSGQVVPLIMLPPMKMFGGIIWITPLCKSNDTFSLDMDINELISVLQNYKTSMIKCYILTYCCINLGCLSLLIV